MSRLPDLFRRWPSSMWRYLAVGVSNTVVSFSVFQFVLGPLHHPAARSQAVAYAVGIVWSFCWNRRWTFRHHGAAISAFVGFLALQLSLLLSSSIALGILIDGRGLPPAPTWIAVMALVTVLGYVGSRRWVFREAATRRPGHGAEPSTRATSTPVPAIRSYRRPS